MWLHQLPLSVVLSRRLEPLIASIFVVQAPVFTKKVYDKTPVSVVCILCYGCLNLCSRNGAV